MIVFMQNSGCPSLCGIQLSEALCKHPVIILRVAMKKYPAPNADTIDSSIIQEFQVIKRDASINTDCFIRKLLPCARQLP